MAAGGAPSGPASATADVAGPEPVRGAPVADQVFAPVSRLVTRGDGTHRLMLRLHPADLGEVKVVMTVKDGVVDVTLSAGAAAREALRDGAPQLRSLLELAGATSGQVVVRDLASAGPAATAHQAGNPLAQQHGQPGAGGEQPGSSGTGADGAATDGGTGGRTGASGAATDTSAAPGSAVATDPVRGGPTLPSSRLDLDL